MNNKHHGHRATRKLAAAVATALGCVAFAAAPNAADAGLMIDLRAVGINGTPTAPHKVVAAWTPGDVVSIDIYAVVSGTNTLNDEGFKSIQGVFRSSTGGLLGDIQTTNVAPFDFMASQAGSQVDIDSDGDLDIGPAVNGGQGSMYFVAFAAAPVDNAPPVAGADPAAEEFLIGQMTFSITGTGGPTTFIDFIRRRNADGSNNVGYASWNEDGTGTASVRNGQSPYSVSGVMIGAIPEPAGAALTSLAVLGLLARRRRTVIPIGLKGAVGRLMSRHVARPSPLPSPRRTGKRECALARAWARTEKSPSV